MADGSGATDGAADDGLFFERGYRRGRGARADDRDPSELLVAQSYYR